MAPVPVESLFGPDVDVAEPYDRTDAARTAVGVGAAQEEG
jgi:hypothetical protein